MNLKSKSKLLLIVMLSTLNLIGIAPNLCANAASEKGKSTKIPSVTKESDVHVSNLFALHDAAHDGDLATVNRLIAQGVDVNEAVDIVDDEGNVVDKETALDLAVRHGNLEIIEVLLGNGADPNLLGAGNTPPLIWAVKLPFPNRLAIVNTLLSHGANPDLQDPYNNTPLIWAVRKNCDDVATILLARGAQVDARGDLNGTALIAAVIDEDPQMIDLLLGYGADVNAMDDYGNTPLNVAESGNNPQILARLRAANNL